MPVSEATYQQVALEDDEGSWELVCGRLREKPPMTFEHQQIARGLAADLIMQLPRNDYTVGQDSPKLRAPSGNYRVPDVCVLPLAIFRQRRQDQPAQLEVFDDPMPLVVEVWSPSTGDVDTGQKLQECQQRGDLEIWRIHPYERTLTAWVRQPDGSYRETRYTGGTVRPSFLPGVAIELAALFL